MSSIGQWQRRRCWLRLSFGSSRGSPLHSLDRNGNKINKSIVREVSVVQMRAIDKSQPGTNNDTRDRRSSWGVCFFCFVQPFRLLGHCNRYNSITRPCVPRVGVFFNATGDWLYPHCFGSEVSFPCRKGRACALWGLMSWGGAGQHPATS